MTKLSLSGKLILEGQILLQTPLIIGSGEKNGDVDITVLKDSAGKPYIPATSLTGVLRHYFYEHDGHEKADQEQLRYFWGADKEGNEESICQSALCMSELTQVSEAVIRVRDGVAIENKYGVAKEQNKFDYEVVEPGAKFKLRIEVVLREIYDKSLFVNTLAFLVSALKESKLSIGAMTTKGFGRCRLINETYYELDFKQKEHVLAWLSGDFNAVKQQPVIVSEAFATANKDFYINSVFEVKNSLIVRSYSGNPLAPDAVHIESDGRPVLPGTSLKGAIRSRAIRIINTVGGIGEELVRELFGWADVEGESKDKIKSRVIIEEVPITNVKPEIQYRIKIDRFTGSVIKTALFDTMPLWPESSGKEMIKIKISIKKFNAWEAGLLLLILKDLWNADLPVGGEKSIGRGVLKGLLAEISFNGHKVSISKKEQNEINISGNARELESFVQALIVKCSEKEAANA